MAEPHQFDFAPLDPLDEFGDVAHVADLETIAEAARSIFPIVEPPDNLWKQIESAIKEEKAAIEPDEGKE